MRLFLFKVLVINAVKDVAAALANLIQATKNASGKGLNDPAMVYLKEAAKVGSPRSHICDCESDVRQNQLLVGSCGI